MTKLETKILLGIGVLILLIDIFLMKYWVSNIKPDPFMSVGIKAYGLEIFGVNILIGIIVFFFRKKLAILFFVNAIVCYLLFSFFIRKSFSGYNNLQSIHSLYVIISSLLIQILSLLFELTAFLNRYLIRRRVSPSPSV